ncbi:type I deoxyribonuclease HsdR [Ktedonobacter robiniae]|uniref:Type I restriction enzyme endonuclease subunit n=2 Tax=Ktedonobacter robiniae TaxID=2778365 RepID=A0ABQ3UPU5_9CHLR|nr:type I deoxyribonuclease HsdR [Ktedonobacter robiniae]
MIKYADQVGWKRLKRDDALRERRGDTGRFLYDTLKRQLLALNPGVLNEQRAEEVMRQLNLLRPIIEGNRKALRWLRGEQSIFVPEENRELNVCLIDFERIERNVFQVTDEWRHKDSSGLVTNRADVVFLINGLPVAIAETKKANATDGLSMGIEQIRRYHQETPEMLTIPQVFEVTQLFDFYYGATWSTSRKNLFNWKDVVPGDFEQKVKNFFDQRRFLHVLRDYIIFLSKDDILTKVILRQHQVRAVEKVLQRIDEGVKYHGLIWHTQGSGKTLTMITIAARLLQSPQGEKPTVIMIVDRNELESQLFKNIQAYGINNVRVANSKQDLQDILDSDYRGLVVSMIHKFDKIRGRSNRRKSIIVLVDEAHRTTGGGLGDYLMGAIPNATYIGFTGTPIDRLSQGKGTFKVFGADDEQGYLDKYSIAESIEDNTTVRLNYALAPSQLRVDRETLEKQFLSLTDVEGVNDVSELNAILDRAVELKEIMKSPQRIEQIAQYIAEHFRNNIDKMGFKAMLVAVDREACILYKKALEQYLPSDWIEAVYSPAHNDTGDLKKYALREEEEKTVRRDFLKKEKLPKILIVTEKLLTGYDAPILYCMYLDKPMRDHVLLQAIARVNRPYEDEDGQKKPYGFILDFVGIFEKLESALAFDSDVVDSVIENIDTLKQLFATWMKEIAPQYLPYAHAKDDKAIEKTVDFFYSDKKRREEFLTFFRRLQNLYEVLSPSPFLRPYLEDYEALADLFMFVRRDLDAVSPDKELTRKTRELLRQNTTSSPLQLPGAIRELGAKELAMLKESRVSDTIKLLNLRKILNAVVQEKAPYEPYIIPIGERAEAVAQQYEERHIATQQALDTYEKLTEQYVHASDERQNLGLDANAFAIYMALRYDMPTVTPQQAQEVNDLFMQYPDYRWNNQQEKLLRALLYKVLISWGSVVKYMEVATKLIKLERI